MPSPKQFILIILFLLTVFVAAKTFKLEKDADALDAQIAIAFSSSPAIAAEPVILPRPSPSADPAEEEDLRRHRAAISRCTDERRVAVIGYGWSVVCLDPKFVAWSEDPPARGRDPGGP